MAVYVVNLVIDQGADFTQTFNLSDDASDSPLDLDGYTGAAQLRKHPSSTKKYDFTVDFPDRDNGIVRIDMTDTVTSGIKAGRYIYDLLLTASGGTRTRIVEGSALVREGATKV
tara:strand:+ start:1390 stop:1731 length:342 start_codon:yes stop_codon:yes gene_type:complete